MNEQLIDEVVNQIKTDLLEGDTTALVELLGNISEDTLIGYLPDKTQTKLTKRKTCILLIGDIEFGISNIATINKIDTVKVFDNADTAESSGELRVVNSNNSYLVLGEYQGKIRYKNIDVQIDLLHKLLNNTGLGLKEITSMTECSAMLLSLVENCGKQLPKYY